MIKIIIAMIIISVALAIINGIRDNDDNTAGWS
jgi:hypothetical protein